MALAVGSAVAVAVAVAVALTGCGSSSGSRPAPWSKPAASGQVTTSTIPAPGPVATPARGDGAGDQPQTPALPDPSDPAFELRVQGLWQAIVDDVPDRGLGCFFPREAYRQVKAISDPDGDYRSRLIAAYRQDIHAAHQQLLGGAVNFQGIDVPTGAAQWIRPGVESNKGPYWRVYGTKLHYTAGGQPGTVTVTSMISWRGQWFVVHLGPIR